MPGYGPGFGRSGASTVGGVTSFADIAALRLNSNSGVTGALLRANYIGGDGGGTFYKDPLDATTADDGVFTIVDTIGQRFKRQVNGDTVSARIAGAALDGVTNDDAALARFDASDRARQFFIDCETKPALVTTLKKGARYVRGFQRLAGVDYELGPRREHPYDNGQPPVSFQGEDISHYFQCAVGYVEANDEYVYASFTGWRHNQPQVAGSLRWQKSRDGMIDPFDFGDVVDSNILTSPSCVVGGNGNDKTRVCVVYGVLDSGAALIDMRFAFTDNRGFSTTKGTIGGVGTRFLPHGYGVSSTGKLFVFGHAGNDIWMTTSTAVSNGAAWSVPVLIAPAGGGVASPREPYPIFLSGGRIIVFIRDDLGGPMGAIYSLDDGVTWSGIINTNIPNEANPPFARLWGAIAYVYVVSQTGDAVKGRVNSWLYAAIDAEKMLADMIAGTPLVEPPMFEAFKTQESFIGYACPTVIREFTDMCLLSVGESIGVAGSAGPSSTTILKFGGNRQNFPGPAIVRNKRVRPPFNRNPFMDFDTRQGTYTGITVPDTKTLDGYFVRSGFVGIDVTRTYNNDDVQKLLVSKTPRNMRLVGAIGGSGRVVSSVIRGRAEIERYLDQNGYGYMRGYGTAQTYVQYGAVLDPGSGGAGGNSGTPGNSTIAVIPTDGLVEIGTAFLWPTRVGVTWGPNADIDATLTAYTLFNGFGVSDFRIPVMYWDIGNKFIPLTPDDFENTQEEMNKYIERKTYSSLQPIGQSFVMSGAGGAALMQLECVPKVDPLGGAYSVTTSAFGTFNQYNGATKDPTAIAVTSSSPYGSLITLTNATIVGGEHFDVRAMAGNTAYILHDANY